MQNDTVQHLEAPEMLPINIRDENTEGEPAGTIGTEDARKLMESAQTISNHGAHNNTATFI